MNLEIEADTERIVREELRRGHFQSVDELIVASVRAWQEMHSSRDQIELRRASPSVDLERKEKARQFVEWAINHPHTPPLSDESISRAQLNPDR